MRSNFIVIGRVKTFNNKKSVDAFKIRPLESVDEISHHLLSICYTHLATTKPKPTTRMRKSFAIILTLLENAGGNAFTGATFGIAGNQQFDSSLTSIQQQILSLFQQYSHTTEGGHVNDVVFKLRGAATDIQIR